MHCISMEDSIAELVAGVKFFVAEKCLSSLICKWEKLVIPSFTRFVSFVLLGVFVPLSLASLASYVLLPLLFITGGLLVGTGSFTLSVTFMLNESQLVLVTSMILPSRPALLIPKNVIIKGPSGVSQYHPRGPVVISLAKHVESRRFIL